MEGMDPAAMAAMQQQYQAMQQQQQLLQQQMLMQQLAAATGGGGCSGSDGAGGMQAGGDAQAMQSLQAMQAMQGMQGMQGIPGMQAMQAMPGMQGMQGMQSLQAMQLQAMQGIPGMQAAMAAGNGMQAAMFGAAGAMQEPQQPVHDGPTYQGQVIDYSEEKGFGFIECKETNAEYGKDMFLLRSCLNGLFVQTGDKVNFKVEQGIKGPKAVDIEVTQKISDMADTLPLYYGKVDYFDEKRGLGFMDCDKAKQEYGNNILILRSQLTLEPEQFSGTIVSFNIVTDSKGVKAVNAKILQEFPPGEEPTPKPGRGKGVVVQGPLYDESAIKGAMKGKAAPNGKSGFKGKGKEGGKGGGKKGDALAGIDMDAAMLGMMELMMGGGWDDWGGGKWGGGGGGKGRWNPY